MKQHKNSKLWKPRGSCLTHADEHTKVFMYRKTRSIYTKISGNYQS